jgi:hypothetical protein
VGFLFLGESWDSTLFCEENLIGGSWVWFFGVLGGVPTWRLEEGGHFVFLGLRF